MLLLVSAEMQLDSCLVTFCCLCVGMLSLHRSLDVKGGGLGRRFILCCGGGGSLLLGHNGKSFSL